MSLPAAPQQNQLQKHEPSRDLVDLVDEVAFRVAMNLILKFPRTLLDTFGFTSATATPRVARAENVCNSEAIPLCIALVCGFFE